MASPTRSAVAHRIVRAYRTTRGDRRSRRLRLEQRNSPAIASQLRRRTETHCQNGTASHDPRALARRNRYCERGQHSDPVLVGSVEFIGLDRGARSALRCGRARLQRLRKVTRRGELRSRLPHVPRSSISLDRRTWFRPCSPRAIRTVEVGRRSIRAGNGWPRHTRQRSRSGPWPAPGAGCSN